MVAADRGDGVLEIQGALGDQFPDGIDLCAQALQALQDLARGRIERPLKPAAQAVDRLLDRLEARDLLGPELADRPEIHLVAEILVGEDAGAQVVAEGGEQERLARGLVLQQPGEVGIARRGQFLGGLAHDAPGGSEQRFGVGETHEAGGVRGEVAREIPLEQAGLAYALDLLQTLAPEGLAAVGVDHLLDGCTQRGEITAGEELLDLPADAIPRQRELQHLPGALVGIGDGRGQGSAGVAAVVGDPSRDLLADGAEGLAQDEGDEGGLELHDRCLRIRRIGSRICERKLPAFKRL